MTAKELAREFYLGIRESFHCPDVSIAEQEGVIAYKIDSRDKEIREAAILEEREACAKIVQTFANRTFIYQEAADLIIEAIRKRGQP